MYYPYLFARQEELLAVKECINVITGRNNVIPILEPVSDNPALRKHLPLFVKATIPFVFIVNPVVGELVKDKDAIIGEMVDSIRPDSNAILGFNVTGKTSHEDARKFLDNHPRHKACMVHQDMHNTPAAISDLDRFNLHIFKDNAANDRYIQKFKGERVWMRDCFPKKLRNADYADNPHVYFGNLHSIYRAEGFNGFGDYTIIGPTYHVSHGAAHAVALHLTHESQENPEVWVNHFVSDRTTGNADTAGKFHEALSKLVRYVNLNSNEFDFSSACAKYLDLHRRQHFPGLGMAKRLSIIHHIELMAQIQSD